MAQNPMLPWEIWIESNQYLWYSCSASHTRVRPLILVFGILYSCSASHTRVRHLILVFGISYSCSASHTRVRPLILVFGLSYSCSASYTRVRHLIPVFGLSFSCSHVWVCAREKTNLTHYISHFWRIDFFSNTCYTFCYKCYNNWLYVMKWSQKNLIYLY